MIRIVNLRNYIPKEGEILIKVDRSTPVGNNFKMYNKSIHERNRVCDEYEKYYNNIMYGVTETPITKAILLFRSYIKLIYLTSINNDVALGCWCAPDRCHAETIMNDVNRMHQNNIIQTI